MSMSVVLPNIIGAKEGLTDLIPSIGWRSGKSIIVCTIIFPVFYHGVGPALDMGGSVGLGKEQHVRMEKIILMKNLLADYGALPPSYLEFARRTFGRSETTCQAAAGSSAGGKTAQGALECGIEVPE